MSDGRRRRTPRRSTVEMDDLSYPLTRFFFGGTSAIAFDDQSGDNEALEQHNRKSAQNLPAVLLPDVLLPETNFALRRQTLLAHLPSLHLPPVKNRANGIADTDRDALYILTVKNLQRKLRGQFPKQRWHQNKATDGSMPKIRFKENDDAPVRRLGDKIEGMNRGVEIAFTVGINRRIDDC